MKTCTLHFTAAGDDVFRTEIPEELRDLFGREVIATIGRDRSLRLYSEEEWSGMMERIRRMTEEEVKRLRPFFSLAELCYDGGDVITLSDRLLSYAGIEADAVLEIGDDMWSLRRCCEG